MLYCEQRPRESSVSAVQINWNNKVLVYIYVCVCWTPFCCDGGDCKDHDTNIATQRLGWGLKGSGLRNK